MELYCVICAMKQIFKLPHHGIVVRGVIKRDLANL